MKEFKAESKRLLDLMINSIYTNKEIFIRELISNCSDAIDKQHFLSLTDSKAAADFCIKITLDKENRLFTIEDNGCGMTDKDMEKNLSTIAKSGTFEFKKEHKGDENLIGQFGVGFYSAFMVADGVSVISRAYGSDKAFKWTSSGAEGYEISEGVRAETGTSVILHIKENDDDCRYDDFLDAYRVGELIKKYSDYIRYPIKMDVPTTKKKEGSDEYETVNENKTVNSMTPIWKKPKGKVKKEEYDDFYRNTFHDYMPPLKRIFASLEGSISYNTLLFIPSKAPIEYTSKDYQKGLKLYSDGVMIMEKCGELLPDYLGFIKGLVDSGDLSLNISREILQHNRQLKTIAVSLEKKIISEFKKMLGSEKERETYEKMFDEFGVSLKMGAYENFGEKKDAIKDILIFRSSDGKKYVTLSEYVKRMKEGQEFIYYACGDTTEQIEKMPQCEAVLEKGYEVLLFCDKIDEFVIKVLEEYEGKKFKSVADKDALPVSEEKKKEVTEKSELNKDLLDAVKDALKGKVKDVRLTSRLKSHAACIAADGYLSLEMEKVLKNMPTGGPAAKAEKILELNPDHAVFAKLAAAKDDKDKLAEYASVLFDTAMLSEGMEIDDPVAFAALVQKLI